MSDFNARQNPPRDYEHEISTYFSEMDQQIREAYLEGKGLSKWDPTRFHRAKNVIDWVTNPAFLGRTTLYEYPVQYQILRDTDELLCPKCNNVSKALDCWDRTPWDMQHDILLANGECPKCKTTRYDLWKEGLIEDLNEIVLILGMRGGKTTVIGTFKDTYIAHRFLTLKDPVNYFGMDPSVILEAGFFAASREQAKETIWQYFYSTLLGTDWYQNYVAEMKNFAHSLHLPWDIVYKELSTYLKIVPQGIQFVSYHSKPSTTAGRTRFHVTIDEMGMFREDIGAEDVYGIPSASMQTVFSAVSRLRSQGVNDIPPVQMVEIGSPGPDPQFDPLERRYRKLSTMPVRRVYLMRRATWEANKKITRQDLEKEFLTDPVGSEQRYGAIAVPSSLRYIPEHAIGSAFQPNSRPSIEWAPSVRMSSADDGSVVYYVEAHPTVLRLQMTDGPIIIVGDAGHTKDRFSLAFMRVIGSGSNSLFRFEGIVQIIPSVIDTPTGKERTEVFYPCVLEFVRRVKEICTIGLVVFDRWDSTMILQEVREMGVAATQENTSREDYGRARAELLSGRIVVPCSCPPAMNYAYKNLEEELRSLQQNPDGRVDHPDRGHNDVVQVLCKAVATALNLPAIVKQARKESGIHMTSSRFFGPRFHQFLPRPGRKNPVQVDALGAVTLNLPKARSYHPGRKR